MTNLSITQKCEKSFLCPAKILQNRLIISRIYVTLSILFSILSMLFEPFSIHGQSTILSAVPIYWIYANLALCIISILDIIINDIAPDKYTLKYAHDYRHIVYMLLALMTFSISIGMVTTFGISLLLIRVWLDALVAAVVAFLDILGRYKDKRG